MRSRLERACVPKAVLAVHESLSGWTKMNSQPASRIHAVPLWLHNLARAPLVRGCCVVLPRFLRPSRKAQKNVWSKMSKTFCSDGLWVCSNDFGSVPGIPRHTPVDSRSRTGAIPGGSSRPFRRGSILHHGESHKASPGGTNQVSEGARRTLTYTPAFPEHPRRQPHELSPFGRCGRAG